MQAFQAFHAANPEVYDTLVALATKVKAAGHRHCSFRVLWETIRFRRMIARKPGEKWALNNNHCPFYVRLIELQAPSLRGFFEKRTSKADSQEEGPQDIGVPLEEDPYMDDTWRELMDSIG
jgi:hypothetical protein